MWDKNKTYISLFFEWTWNGNLWISRDPVDVNRRWIIRPYDSSHHTCTIKFMGNYVKDSMPEGSSTVYGVSEAHVGYCLAGRRIEQIADYLYGNAYLAKEEEKDKCQECLIKTIYLDFYREPNDPKTEEVNVKEPEIIMV